MNRGRRNSERDGTAIKLLLIASFVVGLTMMILGVVFRVYVCHWVAKVMFAGWIGIIIMIGAGVGVCTRVYLEYGSRFGAQIVLGFCLLRFILCFVMVGCLSFAMKDFMDDKWFRVERPYLVIAPNHCVVERYVNEHYYYETIKQHGRYGLSIGSVLIGLGLLEMIFNLLTCLFIGRHKEMYGKEGIISSKQQRNPAQI